MEKTNQFSPQRIQLIIFVLLILYPLIGMGVDLITPALPAMSRDLNVSHVFIKNLITIYLFGYAVGNFTTGFLSDALGRKKILVSCFFIFVLVSLVPTLFLHANILLVARFFQGFSLGAFAVVGRAIFSDVLNTQQMLRAAAMMATMWGIGPVIGPVIGGYFQYYFNWQACFYFFAAFGLIAFVTVLFVVPETHFDRHPLNFKVIKNNFKTIVTHRHFMGFVTLMGLMYSLLIVFNTLGPFLIQTELGHTSIYFGRAALVMGVCFLIGTTTCRRFVKTFLPENILSIALPIVFIFSLMGLVLSYLFPLNIYVILGSSMAMFVGCGVIYPAAMGKGITLFRQMAGSGSAMMNLINILITTCTALVMSGIYASSAIPLAWIYVGLVSLGLICYFYLVRARTVS